MRTNLFAGIGLGFIATLSGCSQGPENVDESALSSQQLVTTAKPVAGKPSPEAEKARINAFLDGKYTRQDVRHSFQTKFGETIDCVDFFKHPGVKELAKRGTPLTSIPTPPAPPKNLPPTTKPIGDPTDDSFNGLPDAQGRARACPEGTAPVVHVSADDIVAAGGLDTYLAKQSKKLPKADPDNGNGNGHAHTYTSWVDPNNNVTSGVSTFNVLKPVFSSGSSGNNFSLSQTWMVDSTATQTVEVGWVVSEAVNGVGKTDPYLFIFSTSNGYANGCWNNAGSGCLTWVPQSGAVYAPGMKLTSGTQTEVTIRTEYRSPADSPGYSGPAAWWIYVQGSAGGSYIGYYPASNYSGIMATRASRFDLGSEVFEATNYWDVPMGTGAAPSAGLGQAGYHRNYYGCTGGYAGGYTWCTSQGTFSTPTNFNTPSASEFAYDVSLTGGGSGWSPYYFYGDKPAVFWGQNYGFQWSPVGDWLYGEYKGECGLGQPITGVSKYAGGTNQGHSVLCGSKPVSGVSGSSCYARTFTSSDNRASGTGTGDWDYGYFKGECGSNEFVQGVAQTTDGKVNAILCCPGSVAHTSCSAQVFYAQNSGGYNGYDWDPGYYKGQCPAGKYVAGLSAVASSSNGTVNAPHALLCCNQ